MAKPSEGCARLKCSPCRQWPGSKVGNFQGLLQTSFLEASAPMRKSSFHGAKLLCSLVLARPHSTQQLRTTQLAVRVLLRLGEPLCPQVWVAARHSQILCMLPPQTSVHGAPHPCCLCCFSSLLQASNPLLILSAMSAPMLWPPRKKKPRCKQAVLLRSKQTHGKT